MHTSELTKSTYSPVDSSPHFQDIAITAASVDDGTMKLRFDPVAFPQKGITYAGTDSDGNDVPPDPVSALF